MHKFINHTTISELMSSNLNLIRKQRNGPLKRYTYIYYLISYATRFDELNFINAIFFHIFSSLAILFLSGKTSQSNQPIGFKSKGEYSIL